MTRTLTGAAIKKSYWGLLAAPITMPLDIVGYAAAGVILTAVTPFYAIAAAVADKSEANEKAREVEKEKEMKARAAA